MKGKIAYSTLKCRLRLYFLAISRVVICFSLLFIFSSNYVFADDVDPEFDEIYITLVVPQIGSTEIPAIIRGTTLYLPVTDIFDFLKIKNIPSPGFDSISGFFISMENTYLVDRIQNHIIYQGKTFELQPNDIMRTESNLYLKSSYFGTVFGLECTFSFRTLSVTINTKLELPAIREMKQELMRKNLSRLKGETKADTTIDRTYPLFHFGMADWSIYSTQQVNGPKDTRVNLSLGTILAGGEFKTSMYYDNKTPFSEKHQYYLWRFANNDHSALRQVMVGKISTQATSTIYYPVVGFQITNTPTSYRRSFGSYTLSDHTQPGWIVELYVNNVLVDYKKADASGFFSFDVPLVYGNSLVKLRFYGPWGEERSSEVNFNIPYNFLPVHELEYTASAGMVEDGRNNMFSRTNINYGVSRRITLGGGLEFLSSVTTGTYMPFMNTSLKLTNNLLLTGDYTYGVRSKGVLSYSLPSIFQFDLNYTMYKKGQKAILNINQLEERNVVLSVPVHINKFSMYSRLSFNQVVLQSYEYKNFELLLSGNLLGMNINFTTYGLLNPDYPYVYSMLSTSIKLHDGFIVMPQVQYAYKKQEFISARCLLEKRLFKRGFLNASYIRDFIYNNNNFLVGFRFDFSFAQTGVSANQGHNITSFTQYASGGIINDAKTNYLGFNNRSCISKGGITILPFLDLNCNGKREIDEPKAPGLDVHINGGRVDISKKDTTIRVFDLEPYTNYYIELEHNSFENIAWQIQKQTICVVIDPNLMKLIEVPIAVYGEASGTVYFDGKNGKVGQGRITVCFYRNDSIFAGSTLTESDGYFSFIKLPPGKYKAKIDAAQLQKLKMTSFPKEVPFYIMSNIDGYVADGLDFIIQPDKSVAVTTNDVYQKNQNQNNNNNNNTGTVYKVQFITSYVQKSYVLTDNIGINDVQEYYNNGVYRYYTGSESSLDSATVLLNKVISLGFNDAFIVAFKNGKRIPLQYEGKESNILNTNKNTNTPKQDTIIKNKPANDILNLKNDNKNISPKNTPDNKNTVNKNIPPKTSGNKNPVNTNGVNDKPESNNNVVKPITPVNNKPATDTKENNKNITDITNKINTKTSKLDNRAKDSINAIRLVQLVSSSTDPKDIFGLFFTVQIGVYKNPDVSKFDSLTDIIIEKYDNKYRVCSGKFSNRLDVSVHKDNLVKKGYKDAYSVAYYQGKKITFKEARKIYYKK